METATLTHRPISTVVTTRPVAAESHPEPASPTWFGSQLVRAATSLLLVVLFVVACWFGAPQSDSAAAQAGFEFDAHSQIAP